MPQPAIRYAGLGTERLEETLGKLFPHARVARMDSDTLQKKEDYRRILTDFRTGKIDILVGTQMIAKGLHFPNVTLVGIIHADLGLHVPDFRAGERTFQLLTQVSGAPAAATSRGRCSCRPSPRSIRHPIRAPPRFPRVLRAGDRVPRATPAIRPLSRVALLTLRGRNEDKVSTATKSCCERSPWRASPPCSAPACAT
jgi:primosomal protein N' (replication factor Y)